MWLNFEKVNSDSSFRVYKSLCIWSGPLFENSSGDMKTNATGLMLAINAHSERCSFN